MMRRRFGMWFDIQADEIAHALAAMSAFTGTGTHWVDYREYLDGGTATNPVSASSEK